MKRKELLQEIKYRFNQASVSDYTQISLADLPLSQDAPTHNHIETDHDVFEQFVLGESGGEVWNVIALLPNRKYPPHIHDHVRAEFLFVRGGGQLLLDKQSSVYSEGTKAIVPSGTAHGFVTGSDETVFISVQSEPIYNPKSEILDLRY